MHGLTQKSEKMIGGAVGPEKLQALSNTEVWKNRLVEPARQIFQTFVVDYASRFAGQTAPPDCLTRWIFQTFVLDNRFRLERTGGKVWTDCPTQKFEQKASGETVWRKTYEGIV